MVAKINKLGPLNHIPDFLPPKITSDLRKLHKWLLAFRGGGQLLHLLYRSVQLLMGSHLTATGRHLPYGITRCYLLPDSSKHAPP